MPFSLRRLTTFQLLTSGLLLLLAVTGLALGVRTFQRKAMAIAVAAPLVEPTKERFPVVVVALTRFGFQPAALTLPEGKFLLAVQNNTGQENFQLELGEVKGQKLIVEKTKSENRFWDKPLNLKAGDYTLSVTENPRWSLALTVEAAKK